ncbi:MAG: Cas10/Cmr2 second palm domain-containing protein [Ardenticatenaceae bacterium]
MAEYTVTVLDTSQIQRYVFSSNRLKENIGASELVMQATRDWAYTHLPSPHNVEDGELSDERIEDGDLSAEVIYSGGGNTVVLFKSLDLARQFTRTLTCQVLRDAPRLKLVVAHREFEWENGEQSLAEIIEDMLGRDLARKKQARTPSIPLLGLSVTAACTATGLVAVDVVIDPDNPDGNKQLISKEIKIKRSEPIQTAAKERLKSLLEIPSEWEIPADFDDLGRKKGEESYIAVIHADGNSMGKRVRQIAEAYGDDNREYILKMREFSQAVRDASIAALQKTGKFLLDALNSDKELRRTKRKEKGQEKTYFPFRPIVFGGDDVTFVCNGKYGLALAVRYLQAFEAETREQAAFNGEAAHACAGIAVVKTHYPFARAYRLSEALCSSAKKFAKKDDEDRSALDWHFAVSGIAGSLSDIRAREYGVQFEGEKEPSHLEMRPVLLDESEWRSWVVVHRLLEWAQKDLSESRNKVKALREVLRDGAGAVKEFLRTYRLGKLPSAYPTLGHQVSETGWNGHDCVYFDAIEAMDFYIDLEQVIKGGANATP